MIHITFAAVLRRPRFLLLVLIACLPTASHAEVPPQSPVDLISLVDLNRDVVTGNWQLINNTLKVDNTPAAHLAFDYVAPIEYDFTVIFTLTKTSGEIANILSHNGVSFVWATNAGSGHFCRLEDIDGKSVTGNPTLVPYTFQIGVEYTSTVHVRNTRITAEINGQQLLNYTTDYTKLTRNAQWNTPDPAALGVGTYNGSTTIKSVMLNVVPEPSPGLLAALGVACGLALWRVRREPSAQLA